MDYIDLISLIGMIFGITSYFLLQIGKLELHSIKYNVLNIIASGMLLYSLVFKFNLGSFIIESFWLAISIYGLYKSYKIKNTTPIFS